MIVERNGSRELGIRILELSLPLTSNLTLSKSLFLLQHFLELSAWIRCSVRSLPTLMSFLNIIPYLKLFHFISIKRPRLSDQQNHPPEKYQMTAIQSNFPLFKKLKIPKHSRSS